jgi:hypothetical protein
MATQLKKDEESDNLKRVNEKEPEETEQERLEREKDEKMPLW